MSVNHPFRHASRLLALGFASVAACAVRESVNVTEPSLPAPPAPVAQASPPQTTPEPSVVPTTSVVVASHPVEGSTPTAPLPSTRMIHAAANQAYCIDVAQDRSAKRTPIRLYTCHGGENQHWTMAPDTNGSTSVTGIGGLCLGVPGAHPADGTHVQFDACTGGGDQQFAFDASGHLRDVTSGKCLTVTRAARGAPILLEPCDPGSPGQVWSLADR